MQRKFEYMRVEYLHTNNGDDDFFGLRINEEKKPRNNVNINKFWNDMGKDGWEVKGFSGHRLSTNFVIFQREIF
jgi:hypothetical protein